MKDSHFGCADCYVTFAPLIEKNIKKLQANDSHIGKRPDNKQTESIEPEVDVEPKELTPEEELALLQSRLKEALGEENYEEAAFYRDKIRELKSKSGKGDRNEENIEMV